MRPLRLAIPAVALLLASALLGGCTSPEGGDGEATPTTSGPPTGPVVRFLAFGDAGTGGADQAEVARAMEEVCEERGCDFALDLGDLVYPRGVTSPDDPQFASKFEEPYAEFSIPFYMVLGNHDNSGDPAGADEGVGAWSPSGDHMVAYGRMSSEWGGKWTMPDRYYTFGENLVSFVALDTTPLLYGGVTLGADGTPHAQEQEAWLPGAVAGLDTPWIFAMGHHPYVSNGPHGDADAYDGSSAPGLGGDHLKEVFEADLCGRVSVYFSGHDHNLQWLKPVTSCGGTEFLVSGAGGAETYALPGTHPAYFQAQTHGFWWFEATNDALHGVAYDGDGTLLFERTLARPGQGGGDAPTPPA
ncbi:MAG TPA: metallophosphoesterase [Candidatus Thermoplasmatota archaeon]|nr:metallophosphoesterase [Candidatus Thermoplasmatota archaeon]